MSKELYITEYDALYWQAIDDGMTEEKAAAFAETFAYDNMRDRYADMIDRARSRSE